MNAVIEVFTAAMLIMILLFSCGLLTVSIVMIVKSAIKSILKKYDI